MSIPDFQSIMLPLLKLLKDGNEHVVKEIDEKIVDIFNMTAEERKINLPSGPQALYKNRTGWARSHLKMAGLIESKKRSYYNITDLGLNVLKENPERIDIKFLSQFPDYKKKRGQTKNKIKITEKIDDTLEKKTPDELMAIGFEQINEDLSSALLNKIKECSPDFFEKLVVDLLLKMGYGGSEIEQGEVTPKTGDEGIDGIIKEDKLGLDMIYIQAKKWENTVGRPDIQKFVGALQGKRARKGIFITTSNFAKNAYAYVKNIDNKVVLIDGNELANLMIEHDVGVSIQRTFAIRKIDSDYFIEE